VSASVERLVVTKPTIHVELSLAVGSDGRAVSSRAITADRPTTIRISQGNSGAVVHNLTAASAANSTFTVTGSRS